MVTRGDPSEDELVFSAKGICSKKENDPIRRNLESYFKSFAKAYKQILEKQEREFFGLRDFYRLAFIVIWFTSQVMISLLILACLSFSYQKCISPLCVEMFGFYD